MTGSNLEPSGEAATVEVLGDVPFPADSPVASKARLPTGLLMISAAL
jgi:hypothetical protein